MTLPIKPNTISSPANSIMMESIDYDFDVIFAAVRNLDTATTIDGAYIYRVGGTEVALVDGGTGASLAAAAGAVVYSSATSLALSAAGLAGQLFRSTGTTAPGWTTATYPATVTANRLLYASGTNAVSDLASANSGVLVTSGAGVPSIATDLPTAVTIGTAYIYRAAGTDVPVTDGGTGLSVFAVGDLVHATGTTTLAGLADVATGSVLVSGGIGVVAAWSASPSLTGLTVTNPISGSVTGSAGTATTATNATNTAIADDTTTDATMYPTWVTANTGNLPQKVSSTGLSWTPAQHLLMIGTSAISESTGTLTVAGASTLVLHSPSGLGSTSLTINVLGATFSAGITAGSGAIAIIDSTGKIPAISSTYFASLNGSALTNLTMPSNVLTE